MRCRDKKERGALNLILRAVWLQVEYMVVPIQGSWKISSALVLGK